MDFYYNLTASDIQEQINVLDEFHEEFGGYFRTQTRDSSEHSLEYTKGLILCEGRRNMSKMAKTVTKLNDQALSNFISNSPWKYEPIIRKIGKKTVKLLSGEDKEYSMVIDESGFPKQGDKSAGVKRQYSGALGKVDNCQVGVFLAYTNGRETSLIDKKLFLPQEWIEDRDKCEKAGIPEEERVFRTKADLALEMYLNAKKRGIPSKYLNMDTFYGRDSKLLNKLDKAQEMYFADIPCNTRVYLEYPEVGLPERKSNKGNAPSKLRVLDGEAIEVRELLNTDVLDFKTWKIRDTQRGELWINFAALRVYRISEELPVKEPVWLLIREELDGNDIKFSFSNAGENTSLEVLAKRQNTRYWVERAIQDAKELAGMDEYQVRGWRGWHHHMTMVLLAMLFLVHIRKKLIHKAPMLTLNDAQEILEQVLPKKEITYEDRVRIILKKHLNRFRSRNSRLKKQKKDFSVMLC